MNRNTLECIQRITATGVTLDDALALRRIAMTLHRWHELECGDSNSHGSWAIERDDPEPTYYECGICGSLHDALWGGDCRDDSARFTPEQLDAKHGALKWHEIDMDDIDAWRATPMPPFMVHHHYNHGRAPDSVTRTRIPDRESGARKRLAAIMARYPTLRAYVQGDPRGAPLYILRRGDIPEGANVDSCYSRGVAVYK